jgi:uncharacterized protein (DUF3084 family)
MLAVEACNTVQVNAQQVVQVRQQRLAVALGNVTTAAAAQVVITAWRHDAEADTSVEA